jgi:hypothetical protein
MYAFKIRDPPLKNHYSEIPLKGRKIRIPFSKETFSKAET